MKKVGCNVYGSGDTIVTKTSHFFQGLTLGAEGGGGLYAVLYGISARLYAYCGSLYGVIVTLVQKWDVDAGVR